MSTATLTPAVVSSPQTQPTVGPGGWWRRWRLPLLLVVAGLTIVVLAGLMQGHTTTNTLDPESVAPYGSRALAKLLDDQGVTSKKTTDFDTAVKAGANTTVFVLDPDVLSEPKRKQLAEARADVVLLAPDSATSTFLPGGTRTPAPAATRVAPGTCTLPEGIRAGTIAASSGSGDSDSDLESAWGYATTDPGARWCYPIEGNSALVVKITTPAHTVTVLGAPGIVTNRLLPAEGNASLAMGVLGANPELLWYLPTPEGAGEQSLLDLLPEATYYWVISLSLLFLLLVLWRGRRLGPVITEPLPVVVRSAETTEGRARLYQRGRARERAATALRITARKQLRARYGLGHADNPAALIPAVARGTGRSESELTELLLGAPLGNDAQLVELGERLRELTNRPPTNPPSR